MTSKESTFSELSALIRSRKPGPIADAEIETFARCLAGCWNEFGGGTETSFAARKFFGSIGPRIAGLWWEPPLLCFMILRHGAKVAGHSKKAEKQFWQVDIEMKVATHQERGFEWLEKPAPAWRCEPIIERLCRAIAKGPAAASSETTDVLSWSGEDDVTVIPASLIPQDGPQQTVNGRRKRFRERLVGELERVGWDRVDTHSRKLRFQRRKRMPLSA